MNLAVRIALDTNIMAYEDGLVLVAADQPKVASTRRLVPRLAEHELVIPVQALAELQRLWARKGNKSPSAAAALAQDWARQAESIATDTNVFNAAIELVTAHRFQIFDALILSAAVEGRCDVLLSEDMADGFTWRGVTVANPFATIPHPRIAALLR